MNNYPKNKEVTLRMARRRNTTLILTESITTPISDVIMSGSNTSRESFISPDSSLMPFSAYSLTCPCKKITSTTNVTMVGDCHTFEIKSSGVCGLGVKYE